MGIIGDLMYSVPFGVPFGASKFTNNEALHYGSAILKDYDGITGGALTYSLISNFFILLFQFSNHGY